MDPITLAAILGLGSAVGTGIIGGVGANMAQWNKNKNRQPQPVSQPQPITQPSPQPATQPANNISQPADVIRKRQMWSKPQQRPTAQPIPQMWSQGGMDQAMAVPDPTDYNARFYEICRQYGLM